ncbi:MAG: membrane integrity-associated transporter subunit PqiC [Alphaproteobacteria bacterium]|nr:MAG: membrane integrity-associated transporter subunit PqiC [Alphaproteobacteria bacterium]
MPKWNVKRWGLLVLLPVLLSACGSLPGSAPTSFYILKPQSAATLKEEAGTLSVDPAISVGIGPVQVPAYADRAQIVTFDDGAHVTVSDFDHWAEPLSASVARIVSNNMAHLIGEARVFPYPADFRPDAEALQISLEILDITRRENKIAHLAARWHVKNLKENRVILRQSGDYVAESASNDYNSYADSLSRLLGRLSVDMARSLQQIKPAGSSS